MRYWISDTPFGSNRVWVETSPQYPYSSDKEIDTFKKLDELSIWKGRDNSGQNFVSWEFSADRVGQVHVVLDGYELKMFTTKDKV